MSDPTPPFDPELDALFAAARAHRPATAAAEYAFETRLLARLQARRETSSAWAQACWRMIPIFGVVVVGLVLWQAEVSSSAQEAEQTAYVQNPEAGDLWNDFK
jgi:hypothetical protein